MREITTPAHLSAFFGAICLVFALGHSGRCRSLYKPNGRSFYIHNTCIALQVYMLFARLWWHRADYVNAAALRWRATRARTRLIYSVIMSWYVVSSTILSACTCVVLCVFCSMCHAWRAALVARREFPIHSGMAYQQRYQFVIAVAVKDFLENVKSTSAHSWTVRAAHCLKHDTKNKMKRTRKKNGTLIIAWQTDKTHAWGISDDVGQQRYCFSCKSWFWRCSSQDDCTMNHPSGCASVAVRRSWWYNVVDVDGYNV